MTGVVAILNFPSKQAGHKAQYVAQKFSRPAVGLTGVKIHDGHRMTSATSYLARAFDRPNLDILVNTRVTKVLPVGSEDGKPAFRRVQFAQTAGGNSH